MSSESANPRRFAPTLPGSLFAQTITSYDAGDDDVERRKSSKNRFSSTELLVSGAISLRNRYLYKDYFAVGPTTKLVKNTYLYATIVLLIIGTVVTGSGPLSGDVEAKRYHLDAAIVAKLHSYLAILALISLLGLWLSIKTYEASEVAIKTRNWIFGSAGILIVQGAIGYRQLALGLPEVLVGIHLLGAALTWIFTWNIHLRMRNR